MGDSNKIHTTTIERMDQRSARLKGKQDFHVEHSQGGQHKADWRTDTNKSFRDKLVMEARG